MKQEQQRKLAEARRKEYVRNRIYDALRAEGANFGPLPGGGDFTAFYRPIGELADSLVAHIEKIIQYCEVNG